MGRSTTQVTWILAFIYRAHPTHRGRRKSSSPVGHGAPGNGRHRNSQSQQVQAPQALARFGMPLRSAELRSPSFTASTNGGSSVYPHRAVPRQAASAPRPPGQTGSSGCLDRWQKTAQLAATT
ncbi:hypothetical protein NDU88_005341 [Pleurodeles waltl]|uniref:Uncharacterized protein n=1 Tax=Pleurodeles waltl TaxID=8319 RepID=A0AAV7ULU4_PLEWA|nr:hypothetical protein NDU88_005341 [Pleurodeles waltl]